jgi:hypothetical protein
MVKLAEVPLKNAILSCLLMGLAACSTGSGGTVLPSPVGDAAVAKACRNAQPDILPTSPILTKSVWISEGVGSAADSLEALRMGFERVSFSVTAENLAEASRLPMGDISRWSRAPLVDQMGDITLEVAPMGESRCAAFEAEVEGQKISTDPKANKDDPMKYWTDTRYPPAPPEGRNWCIARATVFDSDAVKFTRIVTSTQEGQTHLSVSLETVTQQNGEVLARRTRVWMNRPAFPIGVSSVATGCDGRTIGPVEEFFGPTGIALRPAAPSTLINR